MPLGEKFIFFTFSGSNTQIESGRNTVFAYLYLGIKKQSISISIQTGMSLNGFVGSAIRSWGS